MTNSAPIACGELDFHREGGLGHLRADVQAEHLRGRHLQRSAPGAAARLLRLACLQAGQPVLLCVWLELHTASPAQLPELSADTEI